MNKIKPLLPIAIVLSVFSLTEVCLATDYAEVTVEQIKSAERNAKIATARNAYARIIAVMDEPQKLQKSGNLENVVSICRQTYLDYIAEIEAMYKKQNVSAEQVINDIENLRQIWNVVDFLGREQYGQAFLDFELLNARHSCIAIAGDILAKSGVKLTDSPILKDAFCLSAAMKVQEGDVKKLKESNGNTEDILNKEMELMLYYNSLGYSTEAVELGERILPQVKKTFHRDREKILTVMSILGAEYATLGKFADSEKIINERLAYIAQNPIDKETDSHDTLATQNDLIQIYFMQDKYYEGIKLLNDINQNINSLPDNDYVKGLLLLSTCVAMDSQGLYAEAGSLWRTMPINADIKVDAIRAKSDMDRNKIYYGITLTNDLMLTMQDSSSWGINNHMALYDLCNVSDDYLKMGNIEDAIHTAKRVEELSNARYGNSHPITIRAKTTLANAYRIGGKSENALQLDVEAHKESQALYGKNAAQTLKTGLSIAADFASMGKTEESQKIYKTNIIKYREKYGSTNTEMPWTAMNRLAALCIDKGNWREALKLCTYIVNTKRNFQSQLSPEDTQTLLNIARACRQAGELEKAVSFYYRTLASYENLRRNAILTDEYLSGWFTGVVPVYKEQILTYLDSKKPAHEILKLSDMCKGRNLADRYNEYLALERSGISDVDKAVVKNFASKISAIDNAINEARQDGNDDLSLSLETVKLRTLLDDYNFKAVLTQKYPIYKKLREMNITNESAFSEKLSSIPQSACFIDYSILPDKILITVAERGKFTKTIPIDADKHFLQQCEIYRQVLSAPNLDVFEDRYGYLYRLLDGSYDVAPTMKKTGLIEENRDFIAARKILAESLGNKLLAPLTDSIPQDIKNFIISPDGTLANVPFETLSYRGGMLIERVDVSYVPSLSVLKLMSEKKNHPQNNERKLFAVGAVDYGRYSTTQEKNDAFTLERGIDRAAIMSKMGSIKWKYLPGTGEEVKNVVALFPKSSKVMQGKSATERALKDMDNRGELKNYNYLLFSTHGLYVPPKPELSAILLRPDDTPQNGRYEYNGYITVGEWMGYHLNSDLVYLSACESGLGKFQAGEGVVGIPYGLTVAGNKSTVMSLWNIGDKFAADFTTAFFSKLSQGKTPKVALNETKREFMSDRRYGDPSIWSAFLLYGE